MMKIKTFLWIVLITIIIYIEYFVYKNNFDFITILLLVFPITIVSFCLGFYNSSSK